MFDKEVEELKECFCKENCTQTKPPFDAKYYMAWYIQHCKELGDMLGIEISATQNGDVYAIYHGQKLMFSQVPTKKKSN